MGRWHGPLSRRPAPLLKATLLRCMSPEMALLGHGAMSELSP